MSVKKGKSQNAKFKIAGRKLKVLFTFQFKLELLTFKFWF